MSACLGVSRTPRAGPQPRARPRRDDLVNLYISALTQPAFSGVYNATAPNPVRMTELCSALGSTLGRPSWIPVPAFALAVRAPPAACPAGVRTRRVRPRMPAPFGCASLSALASLLQRTSCAAAQGCQPCCVTLALC